MLLRYSKRGGEGRRCQWNVLLNIHNIIIILFFRALTFSIPLLFKKTTTTLWSAGSLAFPRWAAGSTVGGREICDVLQINDKKASTVGLTSNDGAIYRMESTSCRHIELRPSFVSLVDMDLYGKRVISTLLECVSMCDHKRVHDDDAPCMCYLKSWSIWSSLQPEVAQLFQWYLMLADGCQDR